MRIDKLTSLQSRLKGAVMRMYVRISHVGDRHRPGESGDRTLWSGESQLDVGRRCTRDWDMVFDENESRAHADPDVSGYSTKWNKRPGLRQHFEDAKRGEFSVLGFHFADRIGRNVRQTVEAIDAFLDLGVIIYIAETDEFIGKDDLEKRNRLYGQMVQAEQYSIRLAERVRAAARMRALSGRHHGGPPPGWLKWNGDTRRYELVPVVAEAIQHMVDLRLKGLSEGAITSALNKRCLTTKGYRWQQGTVNKYLSVKFVEKMEGHSHFSVKGEDTILIQNVWPAIIDSDTASRLKGVLRSVGKKTYLDSWAENKKTAVRTRAANPGAPFLLSGRIYCAVCGRRLMSISGHSDGKRARYACNTVNRTKLPHDGAQTFFQREHVEGAVLNALSAWLRMPPPALQAQPPKRLSSEIVSRELCEITTSIDKLWDMFQQGTWSQEDYERKHCALVLKRSELKQRLTITGHQDEEHVREVGRTASTRIERRQLIDLLVERIELPVYLGKQMHRQGTRKPHVRVVLRYPMSNGSRSLLSPICWALYKGPREVVAE